MNFLIHSGMGIGDIVQKLPMARALKEQYPDSNIDFITASSESVWKLNRSILECQHYVRNLYWYNSGEKFHCLKLLLQLRMNHYDYGFVRDGGLTRVNAVPSYWIFRIMRFGGCKKLVGFVEDWVDIYADIPERTYYLERDRLTLNAIGVDRELNPNTIDSLLTDRSILSSLKTSRKIIAISTGTNTYAWTENGKTIDYDVKSWAYEKWLSLSSELVEHGYDVILLGGPKEARELKERGLELPVSEHIHDFIGKTTIKQSLALVSISSLVAGSEGGMMHCAAGLGVKTLTVFGGSDHLQWRPANGDIIRLNLECSPCFASRRAAECKYHRCLDEISVEMVLNKILSMNI